ncbi:hypothetical protein [Rhodovulum kholense]|uniref:hypothetical protein n=1 Tax=Rhodovulum kholense TaxID=453584 RepID=UPI000D3D9AB1|nr:hypothetical protein [Rhodovulum kholense]
MATERSTSKGPRVAAKEARGNTADPWASIHLTEGKSPIPGERDWTQALLVDLLYRANWLVPVPALTEDGCIDSRNRDSVPDTLSRQPETQGAKVRQPDASNVARAGQGVSGRPSRGLAEAVWGRTRA